MISLFDIIVAPFQYTMFAFWMIGVFFAFVASIDIAEAHYKMWADRRMTKE